MTLTKVLLGATAGAAILASSVMTASATISDYRKDQIVYTQGEPADSVFYIQSGKVKKTVVSEQGKEAVVAILELSLIHISEPTRPY